MGIVSLEFLALAGQGEQLAPFRLFKASENFYIRYNFLHYLQKYYTINI